MQTEELSHNVRLTPRQKVVFDLHKEEKPIQDIAEMVGISRQRVRQIIKEVKTKIKRYNNRHRIIFDSSPIDNIMPISDHNRITNSLNNSDIKQFSDLKCLSVTSLLSVPNIGMLSVWHMRAILLKMGLDFIDKTIMVDHNLNPISLDKLCVDHNLTIDQIQTVIEILLQDRRELLKILNFDTPNLSYEHTER